VSVTRLGPGAALAVGLLLPLVLPNEYYLQILTQGYVFAISACGLNVILGFAGQLSLAHAGFFGIGAYAVALLGTKSGIAFWAGLPAGIALTAASGYAVGSICLRSKGHYFSIFTLAVGLIIHLVIQKWESLTHGHVGVIGIPGPGPIGPISFDSGLARSYLALAFLVMTLVATARLLRSPVGRTLMAVRESEPLAAAVGLDVMAAKRLAFTISAALAGLAGGLYAGFIGFLGPEATNVEVTFNTLVYVMVGGMGSLSGPVAGTFIVYGLSQVLQVLQAYQMVIFGLGLVLLILFMPKGLAGVFRSTGARSARPPGNSR
jgi:branched-chain amino acid transport system permease protein